MKIKEGYKIRNIAGEHVIVSIGTLNVNLTKVVSLNPSSVWLWEQAQRYRIRCRPGSRPADGALRGGTPDRPWRMPKHG